MAVASDELLDDLANFEVVNVIQTKQPMRFLAHRIEVNPHVSEVNSGVEELEMLTSALGHAGSLRTTGVGQSLKPL